MPKPIELPPVERLHELFEYRDGVLYWRLQSCGQAKAGKRAGAVNGEGYLAVGIDYCKYLVHRIVWAMHGNASVALIDHINNCRTDNRIQNLRAGDATINTRNAKLRKDSTSGVKGVSWHKQSRRWVGQVWHQQKLYRAGYFDDKDECDAAVVQLRASLHGEFARH